MMGFLINIVKVLEFLFISVATTLNMSPFVSPATILCFSKNVKRHYIDILIDLQKAMNNEY